MVEKPKKKGIAIIISVGGKPPKGPADTSTPDMKKYGADPMKKSWNFLKELSPSAQDANDTASRQLYSNRMKALGSKMNPSLLPVGHERAMNPELRRQRNILSNAKRSYRNPPIEPRESNFAQSKQDEISQQIAAGPSMNPDMEREQQSLMGSSRFRRRMGRDRGEDSPNLGDWNRLGVNQ
tara:strand:+ start:505 stop:1047 length:543 start_codon:yes stop_codon:yes gene_type:complete